jgi:hypothetical protein
MFLMSYNDCSRARLIETPYILESTSGTSTLIFPSLVWELILIEDKALLKDQEYIHSGYMDRCTIAEISWYMGKNDRGTCNSTSLVHMRPSGTEFSGHQILMNVLLEQYYNYWKTTHTFMFSEAWAT